MRQPYETPILVDLDEVVGASAGVCGICITGGAATG